MNARSRTGSWLLASILSWPMLVGACGYSEEEWQAQLDKYGKLSQSYAALQQELEQEKARAQQLNDQLEAMGFKLSEEGTRQAELAKNLEELKKALAEYQQRAQTLERIKARFELLRSKLQKMTELGLDVSIRRNRMVISLPGDVVFAPGKDTLTEKGESILLKVGQIIAADSSLKQRHFQVAGHTDDQPLRRTAKLFKDNWGLSVMRAREVLVFLVAPAGEGAEGEGAGLDPKRWSASGYGFTDPVADNSTPEGRSKNRRVELILMPNVEEMLDLQSLAATPGAASKG